MHISETALPGVLLATPEVFRDHRGYFFESRRTSDFGVDFVQGNVSSSTPWVIRGIHYQVEKPVGKLMRVLRGSAYVVAVDLRKSSPNFSKHIGHYLDESSLQAVYIPPGFGAGFSSGAGGATVQYDCTEYHVPQFDRSIRWDDPDIAIAWPMCAPHCPLIINTPTLSQKDRAAPWLRNAEVYP